LSILHQTAVLAGEFLEELHKNNPSYEYLPEDQKQEIEAEVDSTLSLDKKLMAYYKAQKKGIIERTITSTGFLPLGKTSDV
jgi:hypothetical protein